MLPEELDYYRSIASPQLSFRLWPNVGHSMRGTLPEQYNEEPRGVSGGVATTEDG